MKPWLECRVTNDVYSIPSRNEIKESSRNVFDIKDLAPESLPGDHRFDELFIDEKIAVEREVKHWEQLKKKHSSYKDPSPCFVGRRIAEPPLSSSTLSAIDKVDLAAYHHKLKQDTEKAHASARTYRDAYELMKQKYHDLEIKSYSEKNAIRVYWRNKIMEGQTRAGDILCRSIM